MDTNTTQIVTEFGNKLDGYIEVLAAKLGVAVDHFWPIFVRQQFVEGLTIVVILIVLLSAGVFLLSMGVANTRDINRKGKEKDYLLAKGIIGWAGGLLCMLAFAGGLSSSGVESISKIANPEYYAVQALVHMVQ